jgi:hypothetical protein
MDENGNEHVSLPLFGLLTDFDVLSLVLLLYLPLDEQVFAFESPLRIPCTIVSILNPI